MGVAEHTGVVNTHNHITLKGVRKNEVHLFLSSRTSIHEYPIQGHLMQLPFVNKYRILTSLHLAIKGGRAI